MYLQIIFLFLILSFGSIFSAQADQIMGPDDYASVVKVEDGTTAEVVLYGNAQRVRLIGIEIPEHMKIQATEYLRKLVEGKKVFFESERQRLDQHGYWFVYMYLPASDGTYTFVNSQIIRNGYGVVFDKYPKGFAYIKDPFRDVKEFRKDQELAKRRKKGIWKDHTND